ncbi:MAG: Gfo/Idh/MocA family oxidoreductase, partial [Chloroflexaceae bacterium]|nr:Gfo/Idh/MocA family oxidoreductase [Chloroflexaceae bacterium]
VIATPASMHFTLAERALAAGKDVFVEKPLALTAAEGAQLVELAQQRGRLLMVGHVLEYHPAVLRLRDMLASGELGNLYYLYSNRLNLGQVRREENILWSFAPHDIAVILRLVGELPLEVSASGGSYLQPGIADVTVTHLRFASGVRAHIHVSWLHPFKEQRLVLVGSRRMASFDDVAKTLLRYDQRVEFAAGAPLPVRAAAESIAFAADEPLREECKAFLESLASRRPPLTDGASGLRVLQVLQAAQQSLQQNGAPQPCRNAETPGRRDAG